MKKQDERSDLIAYQGLRYAPENELGVVFLFGKIHRDLGFPEIDVVQPHFPDCWAIQKTRTGTRRVWIEFEFRSATFKIHIRQLGKLKPKRGIIVCWENNWPEAEKYADVIELKTAVGYGKRVWIQCSKPEYQSRLDQAPARRKQGFEWTVSSRARPGDIVLMYRSGTLGSAREYGVDESLLHSIANLYEVTTFPTRARTLGNRFGHGANVRQIGKLKEPLRLEHFRSDPFLRDAGWVRAQLQGRPEVTAQWWRLLQLILKFNPHLRRDKRFLAACELSPSRSGLG